MCGFLKGFLNISLENTFFSQEKFNVFCRISELDFKMSNVFYSYNITTLTGETYCDDL